MSIAAARQLLDFSQPKLDVNLLDQVNNQPGQLN